jgi:hypothetical protein
VSAHKTEWAGKWLKKKKNSKFIKGFGGVILFHNLIDDEIIIYFIFIIQVIFNIGRHFPLCRG